MFHDHKDIEQHFAEFYQLLSRDNVLAGSLVEAFQDVECTTTQLYAAIDFVQDPDRELVRNRFWQQIAGAMGPLLTDQAEDPAAQLEIIRNCYVTTPLVDQTDRNLDALLKDTPKQLLTNAKFIDLKVGARGKTAFSHKMEADVKLAKRSTYILTGGGRKRKDDFSSSIRIDSRGEITQSFCRMDSH